MKSNWFLARILQDWYISCKIRTRFFYFLQGSCKIETFLAKFLQDWYISCKILARLRHFLPDSCKIDTFLSRILQDWYISCQILARLIHFFSSRVCTLRSRVGRRACYIVATTRFFWKYLSTIYILQAWVRSNNRQQQSEIRWITLYQIKINPISIGNT